MMAAAGGGIFSFRWRNPLTARSEVNIIKTIDLVIFTKPKDPGPGRRGKWRDRGIRPSWDGAVQNRNRRPDAQEIRDLDAFRQIFLAIGSGNVL
jgi:hypothetical protein